MKRTLSGTKIKEEIKVELEIDPTERKIRSASAIRRMKIFESALNSTKASGELNIPCPYTSLLNIGKVPPISVSVISSQSKLTLADAPAAFGDVEDIFIDTPEKRHKKTTDFVRRKFMKGNYVMHIIKTSSTDKQGREETLYSAILCREDVEPRKIHSLLIDSNHTVWGFRDSNCMSRYDWKDFRNGGDYQDDEDSEEDEDSEWEEEDDPLLCDSSSCCSSDSDSDSDSDETGESLEQLDENGKEKYGPSGFHFPSKKELKHYIKFCDDFNLPMEPESKRRKLNKSEEMTQKDWRYWRALSEYEKEKELLKADLQEHPDSKPKPYRCKKGKVILQNNFMTPLEDLTEEEMKADLKETLLDYFGSKELVRESTLFIDSSKIREVGGCRFTIEEENEWVYCLRSEGGGLLTEGNNGVPLGFLLKNESRRESDIRLIDYYWHYGCVLEDEKSGECFAFVFGDAYQVYCNNRDFGDKERFDVSATNYTYNMEHFLIDTPT